MTINYFIINKDINQFLFSSNPNIDNAITFVKLHKFLVENLMYSMVYLFEK